MEITFTRQPDLLVLTRPDGVTLSIECDGVTGSMWTTGLPGGDHDHEFTTVGEMFACLVTTISDLIREV